MLLVRISFLFIFFLVGFNKPAEKVYLTKWILTKGAFLSVNGSTNVNKFTCTINHYQRPDTLTFYQPNTTGLSRISGSLSLNLLNFDCRNPLMTADLQKALKTKEFPQLTIRFINLNHYPALLSSPENLKGEVIIGLAGVNKRYEVEYCVTPIGKSALTLAGSRLVYFSDFNLSPPKKIGGMVQTHNALQVQFKLQVKVSNYPPSF